MTVEHASHCPAAGRDSVHELMLCTCSARAELVKPDILVTCDLDSTLCDTGHRHHMIDRENGTDWNAYSLACEKDSPVQGVLQVLRLLALNQRVVIVGLSARMGVATDMTLEWMRTHGAPIERVFLDEGTPTDYSGNHTHAGYKLARLRQVEKDMGMKVSLHLDDYAEVADLFNNEGVPTICVRTPQEITEIVNGETPPRDVA